MRKIFFLCLVIFSFFVNQINAEEDETFFNFCYDFKKNIEKIWSILEQDLYIEYDTIDSKKKFAGFYIYAIINEKKEGLAIGTLVISKRKENPQQQEIFVFLQPYWPNLNKKTVSLFHFSLSGPIIYLSGWECNKKFFDYLHREFFIFLHKEKTQDLTFNDKLFYCNNSKIIITFVGKQEEINLTISILRPF